MDDRIPDITAQVRALVDRADDPAPLICLTGHSGTGKSTLIQRVLDGYVGRVAGYMTLRYVAADGSRAFETIPVSSPEAMGPLTRVGDRLPTDRDCFLRVGSQHAVFDVERFTKTVLPLLRDEADLLILDEVGGEELLEDTFFDAFIRLIEHRGARTVLFVWKKERPGGGKRVRHLSDTARAKLSDRRRAVAMLPDLTVIDLDRFACSDASPDPPLAPFAQKR